MSIFDYDDVEALGKIIAVIWLGQINNGSRWSVSRLGLISPSGARIEDGAIHTFKRYRHCKTEIGINPEVGIVERAIQRGAQQRLVCLYLSEFASKVLHLW